MSEDIINKRLEFIENEWPKTVDKAVKKIYRSMSHIEKIAFMNTTGDDLVLLHMSLGVWIRNNFGLWLGNKELLKSCGAEDIHPDKASRIIIEALYRKLKKYFVGKNWQGNILGFMTYLSQFTSERVNDYEPDIRIKDVVENNKIVYFQLPIGQGWMRQ